MSTTTPTISDATEGVEFLTDEDAATYLTEGLNLPTTTRQLAALRKQPGAGPLYHRLDNGLVRYQPRHLAQWALRQYGEPIA